MDSRVTAENHPDDPFGMGTGPTYADRSFGPNQEVIARHNLRPLPWPRSVDLEDEVAELLYHFGIDDDWGPLREDRGRMVRCGPSHWARTSTAAQWGNVGVVVCSVSLRLVRRHAYGDQSYF